jgi:nucleoid-associated protein YgaU
VPLSVAGITGFNDRSYTEIDHTDGSKRIVWDLRLPISKNALRPSEWSVHVVTQGESLDLLAYIYLGDVRLWRIIAELNADVLEDTLRLQPGLKLVVPNGDALVRGEI